MGEQKEMKRRKFSTEITLLMVFTSVSAIFALGILLIFIFFFFFSQKVEEDMEYVLKNTSQQFREKIQYVEDGAIAVRHNVVLRDFFQNNHYNEEETETQLSHSFDLFSNRNMVEDREPFVTSIYLFNNKNQYVREHYYPVTVAAAGKEDRKNEELYKLFKESGQQYRFMKQDGEINICFQVYGDDMKRMGTCIVSVYPEAGAMLFQGTESYRGNSWVVTGNGDILLQGGEEGGLEKLEYMGTGFYGDVMLKGERMLCSFEKCGFGINAAVAVKFSNIYAILKPTLLVFFLVFLIVLALASATTFGIGCRFTKPLREMAEGIHSFGWGNFDERMKDFSIQEFHDISAMFNEMAERIKYLVTQVYEKELLASRTQMKFLQSQINPHFQFNILAMLSVKAKMAGNEELYQCLSAFSKLIQGKIFRKKEIKILLEDEIELVKFYLFLQNSRFSEKISYEIQYGSEEVKKDLIPRLLIEPLVENAVSHGLEPKEGNGHIAINIFEKEEKLYIIVEDNGVGFEEERLKDGRQEEAGHTRTGLENTRRLLYILYGGECSLKLEGKKGEGTRVEIVLPVERSRENVESDGGG